MDITIDVADYKLNIRAAGVIIHNGKMLVHRNINNNHYAIIGGRVEIGENSADTVKREIINRMKNVVTIPSVTSRQPREGDIPEKTYHFVSKEEFETMIKNNELYKSINNTTKNN